jgi:hypothetical protein
VTEVAPSVPLAIRFHQAKIGGDPPRMAQILPECNVLEAHEANERFWNIATSRCLVRSKKIDDQ